MDKVEYKLFKRFLLKKIRNLTPAFALFDDKGVNIALYHLLYNLYNKYKNSIDNDNDKINEILSLYLGDTKENLDAEFIDYVKESDVKNKTKTILLQTDDIMIKYMFLNNLTRSSRYMYFYLADAQCYVKDNILSYNLNEPAAIDRDCVKMIPLQRYKDLDLFGMNEYQIREKLGLAETEIFLFIDNKKFADEYGFNVNKFGGVFMIECAESDKFKILCDLDILFLGSSRPTSFDNIYISKRCMCWPKYNAEHYFKKNVTIVPE